MSLVHTVTHFSCVDGSSERVSLLSSSSIRGKGLLQKILRDAQSIRKLLACLGTSKRRAKSRVAGACLPNVVNTLAEVEPMIG